MLRQRRAPSLQQAATAPSLTTTSLQHIAPVASSAFRLRDKLPLQTTRLQRKHQQHTLYSYFRHAWVPSLVIICTVICLYIIHPDDSNPVHAAIFLSYRRPGTEERIPMYGKGAKDLVFVGFYMVVLSLIRELAMKHVIRPLGHYCGVQSRHKMTRFMEQMYTAMYFSIFGPYGLFVMSRLPIWYFNTTAMFEAYPHREHDGYFKAYYLLQASYWLQQAVVLLLQLEKPRTDFKELVGHHIITLTLIWLSYRFHFTYIGVAVYVTHDISDFFLASSRVLNYLNSAFTGLYYFLFVLVWVYMRHYLNLRILWAVLTEFSTVGPYDLDWDTEQYKCWISQAITFVLLASLQALNLFWLFLILRIGWNYIITRVPRDETSDNEEDNDHHGPSGLEMEGSGNVRLVE